MHLELQNNLGLSFQIDLESTFHFFMSYHIFYPLFAQITKTLQSNLRFWGLIFQWKHRPYDDHVARRDSQRVDEGAEHGHGHVGSEAAAAVFGVGTLAEPHRRAAARRVGRRHTAAVVKHLVGREKLQCSGGGGGRGFTRFKWRVFTWSQLVC